MGSSDTVAHYPIKPEVSSGFHFYYPQNMFML
jgi:hypothetical protein